MKKLTLPLSADDISGLQAGDYVELSGTVYTARDAAHKRMHEMLERGERLPFDLKNAVIYYVGPTPARPGQIIGSAGPTTASRMDAWTPELLDLGLSGMIGKGRRNEDVKSSIVRNHGVYFITCGGAGALLSHCIVEAQPVAFEDLLAEAIVKLTVKDFPVFVGIDCEGRDIYDLDQCMSDR